MTTTTTVRIAAVADLHLGRTPVPAVQNLFAAITDAADILCLCGDLTDTGLPDEARAVVRELASIKLPTVAVLGNHDHESARVDEVRQVLTDGGIHVLDGDAYEVRGVGFAGIKGFAGGFGRRTLGPWGERAIKDFVQEAINEALKLETALARLKSQRRIAMMHYAPIAATVEGEPLEIYPFLGSSRLEEPLGRYSVDVVLHGHAHHGAPEGRTASGVPVYNVSMSLLTSAFPERPPFRLLELPVESAPAPPTGHSAGASPAG
jgi:Icc-related predicted phosphoesterase